MTQPALDHPVLLPAAPLGAGWTALPSWVPIPGLGALANNAFVHVGPEPLLVDTGMAMFGKAFIDTLGSVVDPADLRWIWLSHADPDHTGNLARILELAPRAQVVTGVLGMAKLQLLGHDVSRVRVILPGDVVEAGGRRLHALRPPCYDAPETLGFHDESGVLYAVDTFGATLPAPAPHMADVEDDVLCEGLAAWAALDAPWLVDVDPAVRTRRFATIERLDPALVLTAHLPLGRHAGPRLARAAMAACARIPVDRGTVEYVLRHESSPEAQAA